MPKEPNQRATTIKKTRHYRNRCRLLKRHKELFQNTETNPGNKKSGANNSIPINISNSNNNNNNNNKKVKEQKNVNNCFSTLWDTWEDKPLPGDVIPWIQCSQ